MNRLRFNRTWLRALWLGVLTAALPLSAFAQSAGDEAIGGVIFLFTCLCVLVVLGLHLFIVYWVYKDANKRGNPNAAIWALLTLFSDPLGLILYLLLGRNQGMAGGGPPTGPADPGNTVRY